MVNVGKYTSPMDGMGYFKKLKQKVPQKFFQPVAPARTFSTPLNWEGVPTVLG